MAWTAVVAMLAVVFLLNPELRYLDIIFGAVVLAALWFVGLVPLIALWIVALLLRGGRHGL
jgi:hypothetical protein